MASAPTLAEALRLALDARVSEIRVALPGIVQSYDSAKQRCSVQVAIMDGFRDEYGERRAESLPIVNDVPVVFPGAGSYSITWPLAKGDTVLLVFSSSSLDRWLVRGGVVDPADDRRHTLNDAIAIAGLRDFAHAVPSAGVHSTAMVLRAPLIHAGGSSALALKSDVDDLRSAFNAHVHTGVTTGAGSSGVPASPAGAPVGTAVLKGA
jgi:hypothetical protein